MVFRPLRTLALGVAALVVSLVAAMPGCGSDAVGVSDCRQIETVRCQLAPACAPYLMAHPQGLPIVSTQADVTSCENFYRDQCLNGIENADAGPSISEDSACTNALSAVAACASSDTIGACTAPAWKALGGADAGLVWTGYAGDAPCRILIYAPEELAACNWLAWPDAGAAATTDDAGDAADATDATDAADAAD